LSASLHFGKIDNGKPKWGMKYISQEHLWSNDQSRWGWLSSNHQPADGISEQAFRIIAQRYCGIRYGGIGQINTSEYIDCKWLRREISTRQQFLIASKLRPRSNAMQCNAMQCHAMQYTRLTNSWIESMQRNRGKARKPNKSRSTDAAKATDLDRKSHQ
jgi:hypothetical protein